MAAQLQHTLASGHQLHWYTLERVLGQGGFGITYLAKDNNLEQSVALKEFFPSDIAMRSDDQTVQPKTPSDAEQYRAWLERFLTEARTLARFDHPNIVRGYSVFEANNTAYLVMRYEQGEPLDQILKRRTHLPEEELLGIVLPILDGLSKVHDLGFVHRDCQPSNIYIRNDGSPVLLDFGSAREAVGRARTMTILVAPGYAPFEQYYSNSAEQGPWTDIYGLGATLYRAVASVAPLDAIERSRGMLGSTRDLLVPARVVGQGRYSDSFLAAIDHALEFRERDRPQNVKEWTSELRGARTNGGAETASAAQPSESSVIEKPDPEPGAAVASLSGEPDLRPPGLWSWPALRWSVIASIFAAGIALGMLLLRGLQEDTVVADAASVPVLQTTITAEPEPVVESPSMPVALAATTPGDEKLGELENAGVAVVEEFGADAAPDAPGVVEEENVITPEPEKTVAEEPPTAEMAAAIQAELRDLQAQVDEEAARKAALQDQISDLVAKRNAEKQQIDLMERRSKANETKRPEVADDEPLAEKLLTQAAVLAADPAEPVSNSLEQGLEALAAGNYKAALALLRPLAAVGDGVAQFNVATLYREGRGVLANNAVALDWMRKSAWQGQTDAQVALARMYVDGIDGIRDPFLAYTWFVVAERNGVHQVAAERHQAEARVQVEQLPQASALAAEIRKRQVIVPGVGTTAD